MIVGKACGRCDFRYEDREAVHAGSYLVDPSFHGNSSQPRSCRWLETTRVWASLKTSRTNVRWGSNAARAVAPCADFSPIYPKTGKIADMSMRPFCATTAHSEAQSLVSCCWLSDALWLNGSSSNSVRVPALSVIW